LRLHPTVKPTRLVADAMLDCSRRGSIVLDPFMGSGTTIIAGETVSSRVYGLELDPRYVDVAVRRWERFTGRDAILKTTRDTFADFRLRAQNRKRARFNARHGAHPFFGCATRRAGRIRASAKNPVMTIVELAGVLVLPPHRCDVGLVLDGPRSCAGIIRLAVQQAGELATPIPWGVAKRACASLTCQLMRRVPLASPAFASSRTAVTCCAETR
jgi:hypothetical protein